MNQEYTVIIPAGGSGNRLKVYLEGKSKQFVKINNKSVLEIVIEKFFKFIKIRKLIVSLPLWNFYENKNYYLSKFPSIEITKGGITRQESIYNALKSLQYNDGKVIIHDAVRPFFTEGELFKLLKKADECGNAILAVKSRDTVKTITKNNIKTLDRDNIWLVQTPQIFDLELLLKVYRKSIKEDFLGTDDSMLLEHFGYKTFIVEGGYQNFKITNSFDFKIAQYLSNCENLEELLWELD